MPPAVLREHQRILATYGGVYNDPRLQAMIEQTVERLVAASERPDLHYKVTMLNSQSVNAFALPTGQLYVTRGLIALANDDSELASVLAHEMGHVIARHAEIREEQARQADLVSRVVTDVVTDPEAGALALAKSKLALASFSRAQEFEADAIGVGIASRAGYDPYGAVRFLTSMEHNSDLKPEQTGAINPAAPDFLSSHPATPERITNALANARQYRAPATETAAALRRGQIDLSRRHRRHRLWRRSERRLRARPALPASEARLHLHRAGRLYPRQYRAGRSRHQARRRRRRCGSMSCACRPSKRSPHI